MGNHSHIGTLPEKSWQSWWNGEYEHLKFTNIRGRLLEILLAFHFFIYQYGIVYQYRIYILLMYDFVLSMIDEVDCVTEAIF